MRTLVWFRGKDLRLTDHQALDEALKTSDEVIFAFVLDPFFFSKERAKGLPHRMQFLLEGLSSLKRNIEHLGSTLLLIQGKSTEVVSRLAKESRVDRVVAQRWSEPFARERDRLVAESLGTIPFDLFEGECLHRPASIRSGEGRPYSVFSAFQRAFLREVEIKRPMAAPKTLPPLPKDVKTTGLAVPSMESLDLDRNERLIRGGERAAHERLTRFIEGPLSNYGELRDRMDLEGTSRLSADLKFGTISPRSVWHAVSVSKKARVSVEKFKSELLWREFAHATLWDRPELLEKPFREGFTGFPYEKAETEWRAWTDARTGYPIVDASQRQLRQEGFVHNRARMISASFLTKHLLIDYRRGEAHYLQWLVDGDWAQNNAGWQWSAGCGCDAQPYFRVFNPMTQGEKFDPEGAYVRKYLPELADLPTKYIHAPWTAPTEVLARAHVALGKTYPFPIVDHARARARFLQVAASHLR